MEVNQAIPKKKKGKFFEQTDEEKAFLKKIQKDSSDEGSSEDNYKPDIQPLKENYFP